MAKGPGKLLPGFDAFRHNIRSDNLTADDLTELLILLLQKRSIRGPRQSAEATALLLRKVVDLHMTNNARLPLEEVQQAGSRLIAAQPRELSVGNMVRRVLGLIREESEQNRNVDSAQSKEFGSSLQDPPKHDGEMNGVSRKSDSIEPHPLPSDGCQSSAKTSMFSLLSRMRPEDPSWTDPAKSHQHTPRGLSSISRSPGDQQGSGYNLRSEVAEGIEELLDELHQVDDQIATYAVEQIQPGEVILTNSLSKCIMKFLLKASSKRKFSVMLAESCRVEHDDAFEAITGKRKDNPTKLEYPNKALASSGITVTLVPDSAVFGLMARVNKVLLDADAVLADGSFICLSGTHSIAKAAKLHRTPVIVLSGMYKISPQYPFDTEILQDQGNIDVVLPEMDGGNGGNLGAQNPLHDHVPADLMDLIISNLGGLSATSLYRTISDHYRPEDLLL